MGQHPFVKLWIYLGFVISLLISNTNIGFIIHGVLFLFLLFLHGNKRIALARRLRPLVFYFPLMLIFYVGFSFWLTNNSLSIIMIEAGLGFAKLILMVSAMALFLETTPIYDILIVIRSLWVKTNLPWRAVEDFFMFLGITLRFYPSIQNNWKELREARIGLELIEGSTRWEHIKLITRGMPGLLLYNLRRADEVATAMQLRGYGLHFPRGVTKPIHFTALHFAQLIFITTGYCSGHYFVAL